MAAGHREVSFGRAILLGDTLHWAGGGRRTLVCWCCQCVQCVWVCVCAVPMLASSTTVSRISEQATSWVFPNLNELLRLVQKQANSNQSTQKILSRDKSSASTDHYTTRQQAHGLVKWLKIMACCCCCCNSAAPLGDHHVNLGFYTNTSSTILQTISYRHHVIGQGIYFPISCWCRMRLSQDTIAMPNRWNGEVVEYFKLKNGRLVWPIT